MLNQLSTVIQVSCSILAAGLDQKYAQEVVGDGTNGQVGPFETALGEFYTGNALPVAVGAFSEVNEDASKLITRLARLTAKTDFGKSMSPLVSHSRKGGAFPIMQSQFRRALGCLIARGQAQHLLKKGDTTPDPQHGKLIKQRRITIVDTETDREQPACLAMLGGGRTSSPRDMVCTNSGGMVKTLTLSRRQSPLVVRSVQ
ncbi:hypothetical protein THAOC_29308 [Thalassiosira oceanica]|uniref:Uncharacterized protein n=1 Tax=Thalassiosira oceanica TaxID=159749 RepID=K0RGT1_THAOC|nr:hypothetical protein THAOC_29308 [Thalassiosira oceanica]|eukprot:EJK51514.1 hypothetical protein THAOC_29308 [Thalassiosira oceanica]